MIEKRGSELFIKMGDAGKKNLINTKNIAEIIQNMHALDLLEVSSNRAHIRDSGTVLDQPFHQF